MSKYYEFNWRPNVPERLLKGDFFDRWDEVKFFKMNFKPKLIFLNSFFQEAGIIEQNVLFKCDEYGFFLCWQAEGKVC